MTFDRGERRLSGVNGRSIFGGLGFLEDGPDRVLRRKRVQSPQFPTCRDPFPGHGRAELDDRDGFLKRTDGFGILFRGAEQLERGKLFRLLTDGGILDRADSSGQVRVRESSQIGDFLHRAAEAGVRLGEPGFLGIDPHRAAVGGQQRHIVATEYAVRLVGRGIQRFGTRLRIGDFLQRHRRRTVGRIVVVIATGPAQQLRGGHGRRLRTGARRIRPSRHRFTGAGHQRQRQGQ